MKRALCKIAEILHRSDPDTSFSMQLWNGDQIQYGKDPQFTIRFNSIQGGQRVLCDGYLGFGEAYMFGEIDIEGDMSRLLRMGVTTDLDTRMAFMGKIRHLFHLSRHRCTVRGACENAEFHYDKGNEFYELFLDRTMTYSCAYFRSTADSLETAQLNKYEHICRKLMLKRGEHLIDIGCGWGGMLIYAARNYQIRGLGVTLSENQFHYATEKISRLGLSNSLDIHRKDYRHIDGTFDKFVSIGMFEHVGKRFIPVFFKKIYEMLKPGGLGLLHTIGKDKPSPVNPWILKYIFPGGYLPSLGEIAHHMGKAGLCILDVENLRLHYARTLDIWRERFEAHVPTIRKLFGETFVRCWRLYLISSAESFRNGELRLFQILFSSGIHNDLPMTRDHLYQ